MENNMYRPLAMVISPVQRWAQPYDPDIGFDRGTIFPELDKPFLGEEAVRNER